MIHIIESNISVLDEQIERLKQQVSELISERDGMMKMLPTEERAHSIKIYHDSDYFFDEELSVDVHFSPKFSQNHFNVNTVQGKTIEDLLQLESQWIDYPREYLEQALSECAEVHAFMPVYAYVHSDVSLSTSPFTCTFDSGMVGWAILTTDSCINEDYGQEEMEKVIESVVDYLSNIALGNVYGFRTFDKYGNVIDSCWGFVGSDAEESGLLDHIPEKLWQQARAIYKECNFIKLSVKPLGSARGYKRTVTWGIVAFQYIA